jgi:hypothetical protein
MNTYIEELLDVIRKLHGVQSMHVDSVPVTAILEDDTVWEGTVEVFELHSHPKAPIAYAWAHETDDPKKPRKHFVVLHLDPVDSPETAVRVAMIPGPKIGDEV